MKSLVLFFICALLCSCQQDSDKLFFQSVLTNNVVDDKYNILFIVPGSGCHGCITGAEYFVKENSSKYPNVLFVFTSVKSIKILKLKLGKEILHYGNILFDINNNFFNYNSKRNIYPAIVHLKNGDVRMVNYLSPESEYSIKQLMDIIY